jgi:hypothetical protein
MDHTSKMGAGVAGLQDRKSRSPFSRILDNLNGWFLGEAGEKDVPSSFFDEEAQRLSWFAHGRGHSEL